MQTDTTKQREDLLEKLEKVRGRRVNLGTWCLLASLPLIMMLQSALQELFAYNLPPPSLDRIHWSIAWTAGSFLLATAVFFSLLHIRVRWNFPTQPALENHFHYFQRIEAHLEGFSPFEFASTWIPVVYFFPLVWLQVTITEINNYNHPQLDYTRTVTLFYGVAVFAAATVLLLFIVLILHMRLVHPRDHEQEQEIMRQLDNLYRNSFAASVSTTTESQKARITLPSSAGRVELAPMSSLLMPSS